MPRKQTSDKMSKLASDVLSGRKTPTKDEILKMAGCILGQDETRGARTSKKENKTKRTGAKKQS